MKTRNDRYSQQLTPLKNRAHGLHDAIAKCRETGEPVSGMIHGGRGRYVAWNVYPDGSIMEQQKVFIPYEGTNYQIDCLRDGEGNEIRWNE